MTRIIFDRSHEGDVEAGKPFCAVCISRTPYTGRMQIGYIAQNEKNGPWEVYSAEKEWGVMSHVASLPRYSDAVSFAASWFCAHLDGTKEEN